MKTNQCRNIAAALALARSAKAANVGEWGQCGGIGWTGGTTCVAGLQCVQLNAYYYQCLPSSSTTTSTHSSSSSSSSSGHGSFPTSPIGGTSTSTTTTSSSSSSSSSKSTSTTTSTGPASTGFVKVSGQGFKLNGAEFTVVGENSYWVGLQGLTSAQIDQTFSDIAATGATVVRTWGFNDVTSANGIYYQLWTGSTPTINTGATGLQNFDTVVASAKAHGLRLIVALTNNWSDYGGMDVYVKALTGSSNHDYFYTNANVIAAYKNYIKVFVTRYLNEPTILGWELANEPRCAGSSGTTSGSCTAVTVTNWASQISAYIKSIDSNHLVAIGDEGFYNRPSNPAYPYQAGESIGIDFDANLQISTLDFGTAHLYPENWGQTANETLFGVQWIIDHHASGVTAGKPVILEEYGVLNNQATIYQQWWNTIVSSGLAGDLIWQAGSHFQDNSSPDDGYAVYPDGTVYPLFKAHVAALKAARA